VIVDQFNVKSILAFKAEDDAPIGPHRHRPQPFQVTSKRVQVVTRYVQALGRRGGIEHRKDSFNRVYQIGPNPASVATFIETFQATMLETPNHLV
jgi:hypothetical protein